MHPLITSEIARQHHEELLRAAQARRVAPGGRRYNTRDRVAVILVTAGWRLSPTGRTTAARLLAH